MVCIQWIHPQINECMSSLPPSQKTPVSHSVPPSSFYQNYIIQNGKAVARDSRSRIFVAVINLCELVVRSVGRFSRLVKGVPIYWCRVSLNLAFARNYTHRCFGRAVTGRDFFAANNWSVGAVSRPTDFSRQTGWLKPADDGQPTCLAC